MRPSESPTLLCGDRSGALAVETAVGAAFMERDGIRLHIWSPIDAAPHHGCAGRPMACGQVASAVEETMRRTR